jgi:hypothetical protein
MTNEEIKAANRASAKREAKEDWVKEQRREEILVEERFGYKRHRPRWNSENAPGQEISEVVRSNAQTVQAQERRYAEQNN